MFSKTDSFFCSGPHCAWTDEKPPHVALNAYYIEAVHNLNLMAEILGYAPYRDEAPMHETFCRAFYDPERKLFRDSTETQHASYIGNVRK